MLLLLLRLHRWKRRAAANELRSARWRRWRRLLLLLLLLLLLQGRRPRRAPHLRLRQRPLLDQVRLHVRWQRLKRRHPLRGSRGEALMRQPLLLLLMLLMLILQLLQLHRSALYDALPPLPLLSHVRERLRPETRACPVPRAPEGVHNASLMLLPDGRRPNPGAWYMNAAWADINTAGLGAPHSGRLLLQRGAR